MYKVNSGGYDQLSSSLLDGQVDFLIIAIRLELDRFGEAALEVAEALRVSLLTRNASYGSLPPEFYLRRLFVISRVLVCNVFVGLPNGDNYGYGPLLNDDDFYQAASPPGSGTVDLFVPDEVGDPKRFVTSLPYNATLRPWYVAAARMSNQSSYVATNVYSFEDANSAAMTIAVPVYDDLRPSLDVFPLQRVTAPEPGIVTNDGLAVVVGVDVQLVSLSRFLTQVRGTSNSDSVLAWIFDGFGTAVATSNFRIPIKNATSSSLLLAIDLDSSVIQQSMDVFMGRSRDSPLPSMSDYAALPDVVNQQYAINGQSYLLSHRTFLPTNESLAQWHVMTAEPQSLYYQPIWDANLLSLLLIFLVLVPCVIISSALLAHRLLSVPTRVIAAKMDNLTKEFEFGGDENTKSYSDIAEIRVIQTSFDAMKNAIKSFSKFAPVHVVKSLLHNRNEAVIGVEEVECSIFFSDVMNFTQISEAVPPEVLIQTLSEYLNAMARIIEDHRGIFLDFIGDAVFAQFVGPGHESRAVEVAVAQQEMLHLLRRDWKDRSMPEFFVRVGVNSGPVLAGNVGSAMHIKYTCIGDNVNLTARLEGLARRYGVSLVLSFSTFNGPNVREAFVGRFIDFIAVKGKSKPTVIVTIIGRRASATIVHLQIETLSFAVLEQYRARRFEECLATLRRLVAALNMSDAQRKRGSEDVACQLMIQRVEKILQDGGKVADDWTGASIIKEK